MGGIIQKMAAYSPANVQAAWDNHFEAFGAQDLDKIMLDYNEDSVLKGFEQSAGELTTCEGVEAIRGFFEGLFGLLSDLSTLDAPVVEVTEAPQKQVYLIWKCPGSSVQSATDTFIYTDDFKISRQNFAWTKC